MNNDRLQQNLIRARADLIAAQSHLHIARTLGNHTTEYRRFAIRLQEVAVCRALDRVWEAQCMANGVFQ